MLLGNGNSRGGTGASKIANDLPRKSGESSIRCEAAKSFVVHGGRESSLSRATFGADGRRRDSFSTVFSAGNLHESSMHEKHGRRDLSLLRRFYFSTPLLRFLAVFIPLVPHLSFLFPSLFLSPPFPSLALFPFLLIQNEFPTIQCLGLANVKVHYCGL